MIVRDLYPGMGKAVASRTVLRKGETWGDVAERVAAGNTTLAWEDSTEDDWRWEYTGLKDHIANGSILMSGRHLQHGDATQPDRHMEVFTNCSTAACSYIKFYLLLNGSGVGRVYDDDMMAVNWDNSPNIRCVLSDTHPDFQYGNMESLAEAKRKYNSVTWHTVEDSREGWANALELWESMTHEGIHKDRFIVFDFSQVRPSGSPIGGMQDRPASGPVPLMRAFEKVYSLRGLGMAPWKQAMWVDHYLADCVLVGGVRRSARIAGKWWKDPGIFEFIDIKRPTELTELHTISEIQAARKGNTFQSFLWTANNSVCVDDEFWNLLNEPEGTTPDHHLARRVFNEATRAAYADGTGEPGFVTVSKLSQNEEGLYELLDSKWFGSPKFQPIHSKRLLQDVSERVRWKKYKFFVNPCGEIVLNILGGFCVIADVVPYHCDTLEEAEDAVRTATRALIRVNTMPSVYAGEVQRTNRIGVGLTGIHEFAYRYFGLSFRDLIDEHKAQPFWDTIRRLSEAVQDEATTYPQQLGIAVPHTLTTIKPAGTTSKLFGLTEGCHLPSMGYYMRWVQFSNNDPLVEKYRKAGYPVYPLKTYQGMTRVGFPTRLEITNVIPDDQIVYAGDATPEEQYQWLRLLEKYWLRNETGNQLSYTLKYKPKDTPYEVFKHTIMGNQPTVKCCSVMPQEDDLSYEYLPEEPISKEEYETWMELITPVTEGEDIGREHVECTAGGCPIDFRP